MYGVALKMLFGDRVKYLGLVFGVAFATLLIMQQGGLFVGLLSRTASVIADAQEANIWVMDPQAKYIDTVRTMRDTELARVRGIPGVAWAVPLSKATAAVKTLDGRIDNAAVIGIDDATLIGAPHRFRVGSIEDLRGPDAIAIDPAGFKRLWPGEPIVPGKELELNDRRAVVRAIIEASAAFTAPIVIYARYSVATGFVPQGRNRLGFVLARSLPGQDPDLVARQIAERTGLGALSSRAFGWKTIRYYLANTGIPINFGIVILLGVIVGIAIVGLTFFMFVSDNIRQYAALKAMGATGATLARMVLLQAAVVGGIGFAFGTAFAAAFFQFATRPDSELRGMNLPWWIVGGVAVLMVLVLLGATFASLRRVMVIDPAIVFRA